MELLKNRRRLNYEQQFKFHYVQMEPTAGVIRLLQFIVFKFHYVQMELFSEIDRINKGGRV